MRIESVFFEKIAKTVKAVGTLDLCIAVQEMLAAALDFDNYLVIAYRGEEPPVVLHRSSISKKVYAELDSHYVPSLYVLDPFYTAHRNQLQSGFYRFKDLAPDKFSTTSYFLKYYKKTTLIDELAYVAYAVDGWTYCICIGRDESSGKPFSKVSINRAKDIAPIVVSILESRWPRAPFEQPAKKDNIPSLVENLIAELQDKHHIQVTNRQAQVALHLLRGHSSRSIGIEMGVSWHTVRVFRKQLYSRCNINSQAELFSLLIPLDETGSIKP